VGKREKQLIAERTISEAFENLLAWLQDRNGRDAGVLGVGMDIETNRVVQPEAARFFLSDSEQQWLKDQTGTASSRALLRLWTVKEAIFKADPDNSEKILGEYVLEKPSDWAGSAYRKDRRRLQFHYASIEVDRGFISIAVLAKGDRNA
jgi:phosphopantetheinyl transferase